MVVPDAARSPIVHIVEDDESLRRALERMFRGVGLQTRTYEDARQFLSADLPDAPGCILLDVRLPGMTGLALQGELVPLGIKLPVILMTGHGDIAMSVSAMKAGAVDFLSKPFREQEMLDAVQLAIDRDHVRRETDRKVGSVQSCFGQLSGREREVMMLVTAGKMNKQIAGDLGLSEVTIKAHRAMVMRKMGARSVAELVRMADAMKATGVRSAERKHSSPPSRKIRAEETSIASRP